MREKTFSKIENAAFYSVVKFQGMGDMSNETRELLGALGKRVHSVPIPRFWGITSPPPKKKPTPDSSQSPFSSIIHCPVQTISFQISVGIYLVSPLRQGVAQSRVLRGESECVHQGQGQKFPSH